jgi:hypothetical protein
MDSPRGRIYLMKELLDGAPVTRRTQLHLDRCLSCRGCETTCPDIDATCGIRPRTGPQRVVAQVPEHLVQVRGIELHVDSTDVAILSMRKGRIKLQGLFVLGINPDSQSVTSGALPRESRRTAAALPMMAGSNTVLFDVRGGGRRR